MEPKPSSTEPLWGALRPLLTRLQALAQEDAAVRAELLELGNALCALATAIPVPSTPIPAPPQTDLESAIPADIAPESATPESATPESTIPESATPESTIPESAIPADIAPESTISADDTTSADDTASVRSSSEQPAAELSTTLLTEPSPPAAPAADTTMPPASQAPAAPKSSRRAGATRPQVQNANQLRSVYITPTGEPTEQLLPTPRAAIENIATSCALKADAARWMAERQRLMALGQTLDPEFAAQKWKLIEHAQTLPECYLWMLHQDLPLTTDPRLYADLGNCYEACALIAGLLDKLVATGEQAPSFLIQALGMAALAQATLRNAIQVIDGTPDTDQRKLYQWVEAAHAQYHLQMRHYNRRSKEVNPNQSATLVQQVYELINRINAQRKRQHTQRRLWRNARTLAQRVQAGTDEVTITEWEQFIEAVTALVTAGIPPSSVELRNLLLPLVDLLPETIEQPKNFSLVLREVDHFLDQEPEAGAATPAALSSAEVLRARALLQGESIVFIGGERRQAAEEALRNAFALKELIWIEGHDQTYTAFEPYVARADVSVVILALRWSRHGFGQVKEYCDRYDKLFVRLLSGYNPNQVAYVLLNQIGARLEQRGPRA